MSEWSRYRHEFDEIGFISKGGFGNVFKARHKLDGTEYAIKKVVVPSRRVQNIMHYLEEVKTLAALDHPNIVPYKGAWIEPTLLSNFVQSTPSSGGGENCGIHISEKLSSSRSKSNRKNCSKTKFNGVESFSAEDELRQRIVDRDISYSSVVSFRADYQSNRSATTDSNGDYESEDSDNIEESDPAEKQICHYNSKLVCIS